jgi:signal transduction histidine kinase/CheY-like chemotaxis protein
MSEIFNSYFTLHFNNTELETSYQAILNKNLKRRNIIYIVISLLILLISDVLLWGFPTKGTALHFQSMALVLSGLFLIILIISISSNNKKIDKIVSYLIFYLLALSEVPLRSYFATLGADVSVFCLLYTVQYLYLLTFYYTSSMDFLPGCLITVAKCVTYYVIFGPMSPLALHYKLAINLFLMILVCGSSYFYVFERRRSFYYFETVANSRQWYHNILENMNTGFVSLTSEGVIKYINRSLLVHMNSLSDDLMTQVATGENKHIVNPNNLQNFELLFKEQQITTEIIFDETFTALERVKHFLKFSSLDKFVLIGTNSFKRESNSIYFEVFGRYYTSSYQSNVIESFEFIFNDITRVKGTEEINAEFKFKSMFLAKVAHEFKNPILCITELADQIGEKLEPYISPSETAYSQIQVESFNHVKEIISNIKSMSDYLFILIKDMDFFSLKTSNIKKTHNIDKEYIHLGNLLAFLRNVTNILLKKFNKENVIQFTINNTSTADEIYTDEIKLKQILINLLSNAVKYALSGSIILELEYTDDKLIFKVKDTGKGISEQQRPLLFKPYMVQNKEYNHIGAGLGLSIVKELVELLGGEINYEPNMPQGSIFTFSLMVQKQNSLPPVSLVNYQSSENKQADNISETQTVKIDFKPFISNNIRTVLRKDSKLSADGASQSDESINIKRLSNYHILVVDDEVITRKSTIRLVDNFCKSRNIKINYTEADDGIECLYNYYQCCKSGEKVNLIISDQYMGFMNGNVCAKAIYDIAQNKTLSHVPFYLVTAYEAFSDGENIGIDNVFTKPLTRKNLEYILLRSNMI